MLGKLPATLIFGILSLGLGVVAFLYLYGSWEWPPYDAWLTAWSVAAFLMYGVDNSQTQRRKPGVPKLVLHSLALAGGFLGGWLGMFGFWHKVRRFSFWLVLILSAILHGAILHYLNS